MRTTLQTLMKEEEINQTELSRRTGVPQPTISRILDALHESPNFHSMLKLAKYFKVPVETLYEVEPEFTRETQLDLFEDYTTGSETITVDGSKTITIEIKVH
jgi:transcriptional regulator with XRE-family HTH domain